MTRDDLLKEAEAAFMEKVSVGEPDACWMWIGRKDSKGYGIHYANSESYRAHRFSWSLVNGPIPFGMVVMHACDNPSCVNPAHLSVGTHADNIRDRENKGRGKRPPKEARARGESGPGARLTEAQAREILALRDVGSSTKIARKYGVQRNTVYRLWRGLNWKHLGGGK